MIGPAPTPGPAWLEALRATARSAFETHGFPTPKVERWKYTPVRGISGLTLSTPDGALPELPALDAHRIIVLNGTTLPLSTPLPEGVQLTALRTRWDSVTIGNQATFSASSADAFTLWNTAQAEDGAVVEIAPGITVDKPIHIVIASGASGHDAVAHPRVLIRVGKGSRATIVEHHLATGRTVQNIVTEVEVAEDATLTHHLWELQDAASWHVYRLAIALGRNSRLHSICGWMGEGWSRTDLDLNFTAPGGEATIRGAYLLGEKRHVDVHTTLEHAAPHCTSDEVIRGVLGGSSKGVFNGRIQIHPGARLTDAGLSNKNLLLSDTAKINTKPELEIYNDDVKASHGTTVGQLDEDALFYLRTRGVPLADATRILTHAFVAEILDAVADEALREQLSAYVRARLESL